MRREMIVGQRLPVGQQRDAKLGREPGHFLGEPLRRARLGADHREHALARRRAPREIGERQRVGRARERSGAHAAAGIGHVVDQRGHGNARAAAGAAAGAAGGTAGGGARGFKTAIIPGRQAPTARPEVRRSTAVRYRCARPWLLAEIAQRLSVPAPDARAVLLGLQLDRRRAAFTRRSRRWR